MLDDEQRYSGDRQDGRVNDQDSDEDSLPEMLGRAVGDTRHSALLLSCFVDDYIDEDQVVDTFDSIDDLSPAVPAHVRRDAELRRAALVVASSLVVERCLDDLADVAFDVDGFPEPEDAENSLVYEAYPKRHRRAYDAAFFRRVLVCAVKVGHDLADPNAGPAACTAEEILRSYIGRLAVELCIDAGLGEPYLHPDEMLLEDTDFKNLFSEAMDGLEEDPAQQAAIGVEIAPLSEWFAPFNPGRIVHPYARTQPRPEFALHDLDLRFAGLTESEHDSIDWSDIDGPAPICGMDAISEVVELARRAAESDPTAGAWVLDPNRAEDSFGELVRAATLSEYGSGWLTWEPHQGADAVRTDGVITLTPHRHYPVGEDQAWIKVSLGSRLLAVPLSAVVGYEPDPEPRRRWNDAFSELMPPA